LTNTLDTVVQCELKIKDKLISSEQLEPQKTTVMPIMAFTLIIAIVLLFYGASQTDLVEKNSEIWRKLAQTEIQLGDFSPAQENINKALMNHYVVNYEGVAMREYLARTALEENRWAATLAALESVKTGRLIDEKSVTDWLESWGTDNDLYPPKG
jgi:predicted transcriptional regulator